MKRYIMMVLALMAPNGIAVARDANNGRPLAPGPIAVDPETLLKPELLADGTIHSERLYLKEVPLPEEMHSRGLEAPVPAWKGSDVLAAPGVVYIHDLERGFHILYAEPDTQDFRAGGDYDNTPKVVRPPAKKNVLATVFDGKYLWIASHYFNYVVVVDQTGNILGKAGPDQRLPNSYVTTPMLAIGPERLLAAGSLDQEGTGWIAELRLADRTISVKKLLDAPDDPASFTFEGTFPRSTKFDPSGIFSHTDALGKRLAYIDRHQPYAAPLVVNLGALSVDVYPARKYEDLAPLPIVYKGGAPHRLLSRDGRLYIADRDGEIKSYELTEGGRFKETSGTPASVGPASNLPEGNLAEHDGWLYYAGNRRVIRHNLKTGKQETLVASLRSLPDYGSGEPWILVESHSLGLVAFHQGKLYRVSVDASPKP